MNRRLKKLQNTVIIDKLTIHNKSSRFKGNDINLLLTNQSQVHPKGVKKSHVKNRASHPSQGTVNGGAVAKWPRCRWNVKHNQPTNHWGTVTHS